MKTQPLGLLAGLGILFGATSAIAQMPMDSPQPIEQFRRIEQPLSLKIGVTIAGLSLISLELWWFLYSKNKVQKTAAIEENQEVIEEG